MDQPKRHPGCPSSWVAPAGTHFFASPAAGGVSDTDTHLNRSHPELRGMFAESILTRIAWAPKQNS